MLGFFNRAEQIVNLFIPKTFKTEQVNCGDIHQIDRIFDVRFVVQKFGGFFAESVDIHCVFGCEMVEFRYDLRGAVIPSAVQKRTDFFDGSVANGTFRRLFNDFCVGIFDCYAHNFGNYVVRATHEHFITDFNFLF